MPRRDARKGDRHLDPHANLRMRDDLKKALKHLAVDESKTMNEFVSEAVRMLLTSKGRKY